MCIITVVQKQDPPTTRKQKKNPRTKGRTEKTRGPKFRKQTASDKPWLQLDHEIDITLGADGADGCVIPAKQTTMTNANFLPEP